MALWRGAPVKAFVTCPVIPPRSGSAMSMPVVVEPFVTVTGSPVATENLLL